MGVGREEVHGQTCVQKVRTRSHLVGKLRSKLVIKWKKNSEEYNTRFGQKAIPRSNKADLSREKSQIRRNCRRCREGKLLWNRKAWDYVGNRTKKRARVLQR